MKKLFLSLLMTIILSTAAFALDNSLSSIVIEGVQNNTYNIILRADKAAAVKKSVHEDGTILLELRNIATSLNVNTKYINASDIDNVVVENTSNNGVNIYIQAPPSAKADVIFEMPASPPVVVGDGLTKKQIGWIAASFLLICVMAGSFRKSVEKDTRNSIRSDLAEREIKLYREYKSDILTSAKIDDKIRAHLAKAQIANIAKNAGTIRHLQKMSMR